MHLVYRPKVDEKLCFVLMPFKDPFDSYYRQIIRPAASDAGLSTVRSDEIYSTNAIINDIWARIWAARIVVADVTDRNPNVNYELGLCDALGVPTILITANVEDIPFDYRHRRCIIYDRMAPGWDDKLKNNLTSTIRTALADTSSDNGLSWPYDTTALNQPLSSGLLVASADSRKIVIRGAELVRHAVAETFGPRGEAISMSQAFGGTVQVKRGSRIAQILKSSNPLEERGIEQIRGAASSVYSLAGDGTKLVCLLAVGFMNAGQGLIEKGFHPKEIIESLDRLVAKTLEVLALKTKHTPNQAALLAVATTAASGDARAASLVVEAVNRAGKDGIVSIETTERTETALEVREGIFFASGYLSEYFVTNPQTLECVLDNCLILLYERRINSALHKNS